MKAFHNGKIIEPESHELCAVYHPKDGRILHVHEAVRWPGAPDHPAPDLEKRALEMAARIGHDTSALKTFRVDLSSFDPRKRYKIDPKALRLVAIKAPAPVQNRAGRTRSAKPKAASQPRTKTSSRQRKTAAKRRTK